MQSTTIIAFDQHAAPAVAAVLPPAHRTPALDQVTLTAHDPSISISRVQRQDPVCC